MGRCDAQRDLMVGHKLRVPGWEAGEYIELTEHGLRDQTGGAADRCRNPFDFACGDTTWYIFGE